MHHEHPTVEGVESTASIGGHPIHPMLIPFPIALLSSALATDLAYAMTRRPFWALASRWLTWAGAGSAAVAGAFGATDFLTISKARSHTAGWIHAIGNVTALALAVASIRVRRDDAVRGALPAGLALSGLIATILTVTGWYGGELSYRHGIGMIGHDHERRGGGGHGTDGHDLHEVGDHTGR